MFFVYDLSPFMVRVTEHNVPFTHFLTGLCAIAGGVFTVRQQRSAPVVCLWAGVFTVPLVAASIQVAGIIDSCIHHSSKRLKQATGRL